VSPAMETVVPGFYVAGDASGHCRGIVYSAVSGLLAARNIKDVAAHADPLREKEEKA